MKRTRLSLHRETLRTLSPDRLGLAAGFELPPLDADPKDPSKLLVKIDLACPTGIMLSCLRQPVCPVALAQVKKYVTFP